MSLLNKLSLSLSLSLCADAPRQVAAGVREKVGFIGVMSVRDTSVPGSFILLCFVFHHWHYPARSRPEACAQRAYHWARLK